MTTEFAEPSDQDWAEYQLSSQGVEFRATVFMDPAEERWVAGWIQNMYPFDGCTEYQRPDNPNVLRVWCRVSEQRRDGEAAADPIWYEKAGFQNGSATVNMTDEPNLQFHRPVYAGNLLGDAAKNDNWRVQRAYGAKSFCTWLAVRDPQTEEIIRLKYITWEVDFASAATGAGDELTLATTTGGTRITGEADGPGGEPVLDKGLDEHDAVWSASVEAS